MNRTTWWASSGLIIASLAIPAAAMSGERPQYQGEASAPPLSGKASQSAADDPAAAYQRGDYATAVTLGRPDAEAGMASAQLLLGMIYVQGGGGVSRNDAEAAKWFRKAADQGDAKAQYNLGLMYDKGRGVPQDYAAAVNWYRKAANQGHIAAQTNLGSLYNEGRGVPQDRSQAVRWFLKAAEQDDPVSQFNLGVAYAQGLGIAQDNTRAYVWFSLAAGHGQPAATSGRDAVAANMTSAQIAEAQKRVREWKPKKTQ